MFFSPPITFENVSSVRSVLACFAMATVYVGSLYLWRHENRYKRNEPDVIRRRFVSVSLSCLLSLGLLYALGEEQTRTPHNNGEYALADWIGLSIVSPLSHVAASFVSIFLTLVLFLGPIVQYLVLHTDFNNNNRRNNSSSSSSPWHRKLVQIYKQLSNFKCYNPLRKRPDVQI